MGGCIPGATNLIPIERIMPTLASTPRVRSGAFRGGASPYGIEDLSGNVWEWTRSLWGKNPYPTGQKARARREDLQASQDKARVLRGGAFGDSHGDARCAYRYGLGPSYRGRRIGFRVVVRPCV